MHRWSLGVVLALLVTVAPVSRAQDLSPAEKALVRSVEARLGEEMAAIEKVVNIDSGTFNAEGVREVGRFFEKELQALGFATRWIPMPEAMHRAGHLLAERVSPKPSGKRVLLLGHMDTVFEGQGHRFQNDGGVIRGAGVIDMKGGDVVLLFALKALESAGMLKGATVRVFLTGDEENPGLPTSESRRDARRGREGERRRPRLRAGVGVQRDDGPPRPKGSQHVVSRRHRLRRVIPPFVLRSRSGAGAIYEASRILDGFRAAFSAGNVTVNPGLFLGGTDVAYDATKSAGTSAGKFNVVSRSATVKGDLRALDEAEREAAKARMREIVAASLPKASAKIEFDDVVPAVSGHRGKQIPHEDRRRRRPRPRSTRAHREGSRDERLRRRELRLQPRERRGRARGRGRRSPLSRRERGSEVRRSHDRASGRPIGRLLHSTN